jgi:hypothetical protein
MKKPTGNQLYSLGIFAFVLTATLAAPVFPPVIYLLGCFMAFHFICTLLARTFHYKTLVESYQKSGHHLPGWVDIIGYGLSLAALAIYHHPAIYLPWAFCFFIDLKARGDSMGIQINDEK